MNRIDRSEAYVNTRQRLKLAPIAVAHRRDATERNLVGNASKNTSRIARMLLVLFCVRPRR